MHNKRQCLIGIFLKSQKGAHISRKRGQKGGLGGQGPKGKAKGGHGRAPPKKNAVRQLWQGRNEIIIFMSVQKILAS